MSIESTEVLIIDDSPTDAELTMHTLSRESAHASVTWLLNAEDVDHHLLKLERTRQRALPPTLVLLDTDLPGGAGLRILERLKSDPQTRLVPVVIFTARTDELTVRRCFELGANSYVVKPRTALEYLQVVSTVTDFWLTLNHRFAASTVAERGEGAQSVPDPPTPGETPITR